MADKVCHHEGDRCREILVWQLAQLLATAPEAVRAVLCVEALRKAKRG
jgi:hypothetical protein